MATGLLDNYNLRYNLGTAQLEMNTGGETWIGVPSNLGDIGLADGKILVGSSDGIAAAVSLSGAATIVNTGVISLTSTSVTSALLTNYVSGSGTVGASDTILQGVNKLNGNAAAISTVANAALARAGGAMTGALTFTGTTFAMTPPILTDTQMNALTPTEGMTIYNSTSHALAFYNGTSWKVVATV